MTRSTSPASSPTFPRAGYGGSWSRAAAASTLFLTSGLVDELHLVVAPFFVGDPSAPRFVGLGPFPYGPANPLRLAETRQIGDVVLLRYLPQAPDAVSRASGGLSRVPGESEESHD